MDKSYKNAGVDIEKGEQVIDSIKSTVKETFSKNVLQGIGHFGAFYELDLKKYKNPVLVSSVDGVGTKLKIAIAANKHNTVGQDLVNHCVNDIAVCGAQPIYFMDYLAFGKLDSSKAVSIIEGFAKACKENNVSLIGGETAEMPGLYDPNDYDMSGTIVGVVEKDNVIDGKNIKPGDVLIGFESNGLHTNGYSLARTVLFDKYKINDQPGDIELNLGDELLKVHKSYLHLITALINNVDIKAFSHITGGGIIGNTKRVVPKDYKIKIDWSAWELPAVFKLIKETGNISDDEMRKVFNLGIGLISVVDKSNVDKVLKIAEEENERAIIIGNIV